MLVVRILVDQLTVSVLKHCRFTFEHCWHLDISRTVLSVKDVIEILRLLVQLFHYLWRQFVKVGFLLAEIINFFVHGLVKFILTIIMV